MTRKKVITREVKIEEELNDCKARCLCGHVVIMSVHQDSDICTWCGRKMTNNSKNYFKYKLRQMMKK